MFYPSLRTFSVSILLLAATWPALAGDDGSAFLGYWSGPARFGSAQTIIINKVGGRWSIIGLVLDKGPPQSVTPFNANNITFDPEKGLSYREEFPKTKAVEPAQVTLMLKDKTQMRAVAVLADKKTIEFELKKTSELGKKDDSGKKPVEAPPIAAGDITKIEGEWQGKLSFEVDMFWTVRVMKEGWKITGELKQGGKAIGRLGGVGAKPDADAKDIVFSMGFLPPSKEFGSEATFRVSANERQLLYHVIASGKKTRNTGFMARVPGTEPVEKPPIPIVKDPGKKPKDEVAMPGAGGATGLAFTPDGKQLVVANQRGSVHVMNVADEKIVQTIDAHKDGVSALALSANGKLLATGGRDKLVKLWDFESGELLHTLEGFNRHVTAVAFSADNKLVAAAEHFATLTGQPAAKIMVWKTADSKKTMTVPGDANGLAFTPDGKMLVSNGGQFKNPKMPGQTTFTLHFWSMKGTLAGTVPGNVGIMYKVRVSPLGKQVAWCGENNQILVFNLALNKVQFVLPVNERYNQDLAFTPDGKKLVTLAEKGVVRVWDMSTGKQIATSQEHTGPVRHLALSPDGTQAAVGGYGRPLVMVLDLPGKK